MDTLHMALRSTNLAYFRPHLNQQYAHIVLLLCCIEWNNQRLSLFNLLGTIFYTTPWKRGYFIDAF